MCNHSTILSNRSITLCSIIRYLNTIHHVDIALGAEEEEGEEEALDMEEV
jgi:hypothetical protein